MSTVRSVARLTDPDGKSAARKLPGQQRGVGGEGDGVLVNKQLDEVGRNGRDDTGGEEKVERRPQVSGATHSNPLPSGVCSP